MTWPPGGGEVLEAIAAAHVKARARVHAAGDGPRVAGLVAVDIDETLITARSEHEDARPNHKHGFGHHPVFAFLDHGEGGTGEALAGLLRPGNANANNAADLLTILDGLAQRPQTLRHRLLIRPPGGSAPGAQLRLTDADGRRITCFATNTTSGQPADLELRHRRRARVEDRIRCAKDTGLPRVRRTGWWRRCDVVVAAFLRQPGPDRRDRWVRSGACTWDVSSTQSTIAFSGGCRYRPTMSRIFASRAGSVEKLNVSVRHGCKPHLRQGI